MAREHDSINPPGSLPPSEVAARLALQGEQFRHDNTIRPLAPRPDEPVEVWATNGLGLPIARAAVFYQVYETAAPDPVQTAPPVRITPMERAEVEWDARAGYLTHWRAALPPQPEGTIVRYRIGGWRTGHASVSARDTTGRAGVLAGPDMLTPAGAMPPVEHPASDAARPDVWARDGQGFHFHDAGAARITTFAYRVERPDEAMPAWARGAVIYHIFLDRFHPGNSDGAFTPDASPAPRRRVARGARRPPLPARARRHPPVALAAARRRDIPSLRQHRPLQGRPDTGRGGGPARPRR